MNQQDASDAYRCLDVFSAKAHAESMAAMPKQAMAELTAIREALVKLAELHIATIRIAQVTHVNVRGTE